MEVDSTPEENRRQSAISCKESSDGKEASETVSPEKPKVPKKFINNWRQACDRTKDRTKELLKKWRTVPETGSTEVCASPQTSEAPSGNNTNWTEHVWTTWVKRTSSKEEESQNVLEMSEIQRMKFSHFFISYLDLDRDDCISLADFDGLTERLRHFSDWSKNSSEYHRLREVQEGFIQTFLLPPCPEGITQSYKILEKKLKKEQLSLDQWLNRWMDILSKSHSFHDLPLWLQYFPKILFQIINRSGTGKITKEELSTFFASILSLTSLQVTPFVDEAFDALTSNSQHPLTYSVYRLSYANFIFARYPNGPGQYIFGPIQGIENYNFVVDYKFLNCAPQELEHYSPKCKTNRTSIIV
ncbi:hypothetical protein RUM43_007494 [Polyplax serrata]|uniref:EF-hand domain-containing protein n=1 Tax=Polyplax serrata TaxID=468196 RepID=A0AAN8P5X2_POLSC